MQDRITALFAEKMNLQVSSADTDVFEAGILDSLAFVDLLAHLEQEFGIKVAVEDIEIDNFRSIKAIAEFMANVSELSVR